jgi:excisionase family DNA binding protein
MRRPAMTAGNVKPKLTSRHTAAKILGGINLRTVDRLVKAGKIRGVKVGSRAFLVTDSIDEFLADSSE